MDRMKKLRDKKGEHKMHPMEQKAKMGVVSDLQKMAEDAMGDRLKGLNKVSVASDSPEGLQEGLEHAHDVLKHIPSALDDSHSDHENFEGSERPEDGQDGMSAYPDSDDGHELESDPMKAHEEGEMKEGGEAYADGGHVGDYNEGGMAEDESAEDEMGEEDGEMSDEEIDAQIAHLKAMKKRKGKA